MRYIAALLAMLLLMSVSGFAQTTAPLSAQPESIIEIIDIIESVRSRAFNDGMDTITRDDYIALRAAAEKADDLGAEDLAAQARMLQVYLRDPVAATPGSRPMDLEPMPVPTRPEFNERLFKLTLNAAGVVGATALVASGVFHYLAEGKFESAVSADDPDNPFRDPDLAEKYRTEWRVFDQLSLWTGVSGAAILVGGVPLALSSGGLWAADLSVEKPPVTYTRQERLEAVATLQARRSEVMQQIRDLGDKDARRQTVTRWSLGVGAGGLAISAASLITADLLYREYLKVAYTTDENAVSAKSLGTWVRILDFVGISGGTVAAAGLGTAATISIVTKSRPELIRELQEINEEIIDLRLAEQMAIIDARPPTEAAE